MTWAVGAIESSDPRTLLEKVLAEFDKDLQLISFVGDDEPNFFIPFEVWEALENQKAGIGLSLYIDEHVWTTRPHDGVEKQIELRCEELGVYFFSSDLSEATKALLKSLRSKFREGEHRLFLGRYSDSGQFNLHFSQEMICELARLKVSIHG